MPATSSPATDAAAALLDELVARGLRHIIVCPGSRSQALALAAADLDRQGRARLHVRLDERSAGFFALGLARASGVPAAVIVTSGTAVANLLPAVAEAHHSGVPLLLLTADRPPELRGIGANQATQQPGMFASFVRFEIDAPTPTGPDASGHRDIAARAWDASTAAPAGPAHVNLPFREPLAGAFPAWWTEPEQREPRPTSPDLALSDEVDWANGARTIVVAGADAGHAAVEAAETHGWPLVAEIVSGARVGANVVRDYRGALRQHDLGGAVQRVVVFGHPTLTREVTALLSRTDVDVVAVRGPGERLNLNGRTRSVAAIDGALPGESAWLSAWTNRPPTTPTTCDDVPVALTREALVRAVWHVTGDDDAVLWGSSRLVRVADSVLEPRAVRVHANRGLAGIDGTIATACGIAAETEGITRVVLGDLTFLHDVGSLLQPADEPAPRVQVIIGNDGGGTIFDTLEVAGIATPEAFARVQYTPQQVDIASLARAYGWTHTLVTDVDALSAVLAESASRHIIEVPLDR